MMNEENKLRFDSIPQLPRAYYEVDVSWDYLESNLERYIKSYGLDLEPEFQRAHVWTREQQTAYIEYMLMGGEVGRNVTFNCPNFMGMRNVGQMTIVDGKQRIEAVRAFLRGDVKAFGHMRSEYEKRMEHHIGFKFRICGLTSQAEILELYLNINAGGTPHTDEELNRVRALLAAEESKC